MYNVFIFSNEPPLPHVLLYIRFHSIYAFVISVLIKPRVFISCFVRGEGVAAPCGTQNTHKQKILSFL